MTQGDSQCAFQGFHTRESAARGCHAARHLNPCRRRAGQTKFIRYRVDGRDPTPKLSQTQQMAGRLDHKLAMRMLHVSERFFWGSLRGVRFEWRPSCYRVKRPVLRMATDPRGVQISTHRARADAACLKKAHDEPRRRRLLRRRSSAEQPTREKTFRISTLFYLRRRLLFPAVYFGAKSRPRRHS